MGILKHTVFERENKPDDDCVDCGRDKSSDNDSSSSSSSSSSDWGSNLGGLGM